MVSVLHMWLLVVAAEEAAVSGGDSPSEDVPEPRNSSHDMKLVVPVVMVGGKNVVPATSRSHETPRAFETGPANQYPLCSTNPAFTIPHYFPDAGHGTQPAPSHPSEYPTAPSYGPGGYPNVGSYGPVEYHPAPSYPPAFYRPAGYQPVYSMGHSYMAPYPRNQQSPMYNTVMYYPNYPNYPNYGSPYFRMG